MSQINLQRFVDIDIRYNIASAIKSTRDTVVLLTTEGSNATDAIYDSYEAVIAVFDNATTYASTRAYAKIYFDNGGVKLKIAYAADKAAAKAAISALSDEYIVVAFTGAYADIKEIAQDRNNANPAIYGIHEKILLGCTSSDDTDSVKNFAVKYSSVVGAEMTIAAYLSQINVYSDDSIKDYAFTKEIITAEPADDAVLGSCINHDMNVTMFLSAANRNIGGNMKDGYPVSNAFALIVLQQTCTDRVLSVLVEKVKGSEGVNKISSAVGQELSKYVANGYLTTDKIWSKPDLVKTYNGTSYTVISKGDNLPLGYKVVVLPYNSLSDADKTAKKAPPIYVVLADAYGIRAVTISGEVI